MKKRPPLAARLLDKLKKLGMPERKAKEVAKGLAPTAARQSVSGTVTGKLEAKLVKLGLSERKAKEMAKGLAPVVRSAIKAKAKAHALKLDEVDDAFVNEIVAEGIDVTENEELDKVAPRVNGHRVRLDLPVVARTTWMAKPVEGIQLLRVIDGLSTNGTYLVAAVKQEVGMVAVRQFDADHYNVKFYPTMGYWGKTPEDLSNLGGFSFLNRQWYERCHTNREGLGRILQQLALDAKPKSRMKALMDRFLTVGARPLVKAFDYLHRRVGAAA